MEKNDNNKNNKKEYSEEKMIEIEKKELENLRSLLDDEDNEILNDYQINPKNENKPISIFKSTDFNDFPESNPNSNNNNKNKNNNNKKNLIKNKIDIKLKYDNNKNENNKIEEESEQCKNLLYESDEEKNDENDDNIKDYDLDNEINLEEQLKKEYDEFIDNEKINEDISDNELLSMSKENIIQYKNYQILKLKTIIKTLRQEKETLIENYKKTTDNLLKHIKELEYRGTGERPMTAKIINKIVSSSDIEKTSEDNYNNINNKERCPNCGKIIKNNFMEHSLECIRKKYKCVWCNELMNIEEKEKHNKSFYNKEKLYEAIKNKNKDYIIKVLRHNFPINDIILDDKTGDYFIHLIIKNNIFYVIKDYENNINVNLENKQKETPLFLAINSENINLIKDLLHRGADINKRNKGDLSPLMLCCKKNYQNIAEILIKKGAKVNEKNILGDTPVKIAQLNGNEELALKLINLYKAEIN